MWAGPKKGDKIGDRIRGEAELDRARFSGGARAIYGPYSNGSGHKTLKVLIFSHNPQGNMKRLYDDQMQMTNRPLQLFVDW